MNPSTNRVFLLWLAAAAAVARAQQPEQPPPDGGVGKPASALAAVQGPKTLAAAWSQAMQTMRAQKAPGLVFVLPAADAPLDAAMAPAAKAALEQFRGKGLAGAPVTVATARDLMLLQIQLLRQGPLRGRGDDGGLRPALAAAFGLAVPVVAPAASCGALPGETIVLLGEDGRRTAGFAVPLGDGAAVERALAPHLFAAERLAARAANTPPQVQRAVATIRVRPADDDAEGQQRFATASSLVQQQLHAAAPMLIGDEPAEVPPARGDDPSAVPLRWLLQFTTPLGTEVGVEWDPCPPCGMMAAPLPMRSALKLLAQ